MPHFELGGEEEIKVLDVEEERYCVEGRTQNGREDNVRSEEGILNFERGGKRD